MRKFLYIMVAAVAVFASCSKENAPTIMDDSPEEVLGIPEQLEGRVIPYLLDSNALGVADALMHYGEDDSSKFSLRNAGHNYHTLDFTVKDSTYIHADIYGSLVKGFDATVRFGDLDLEVNIHKMIAEVSIPTIDVMFRFKLSAILPKNFRVDICMDGKEIGYACYDDVENEDRLIDKMLTIHYYDDTRVYSFAGTSFSMNYGSSLLSKIWNLF